MYLSHQAKAMLILSKIPALLKNGTQGKETTLEDQHFLLGYRWNMLLSYNTGVRKYIKFAEATQRTPFRLPLSERDVYAFCYWAGRNTDSPTGHNITANTLVKYLLGLQAWHLLHETKYPDTKQKVGILIKSSAQADANLPANPKKKVAGLQDVLGMVDYLMKGAGEEKAMMDLTIVAFWGMARLSELTSKKKTGTLNKATATLTTDVSFYQAKGVECVALAIRGAKTSAPGEIQRIYSRSLRNMLCPVLAIRRRLAKAKGEETSLFGYYSPADGTRIHVTKEAYRRVLKTITQVDPAIGLTGHSFRVGGASLRFALGVSTLEICELGRWTSDCYKLYIREYTPQELAAATATMAQLDSCWST
ncbi:hypothetical protein MJO28_015520 [Puccinia striiformis f. sp. tritici]|uniref:Uncharacterized protein n=1 Tax=Puccinia striiformis f. sp. tritici TaxID=168172 RepID=A0ACC0DQX3_9BASI|nr:hypothetical protein MJO28_015520 [Puccinia striiformis f. sp. tritici]